MRWKFKGGLFTLLLWTAALVPNGASAITAEFAKQCNALVYKQFPPRQAGKSGGGHANGNAQAERDHFKKCVDNGGKMDDASAPAPSPPPAPNAK